jgi:hypothetical protein
VNQEGFTTKRIKAQERAGESQSTPPSLQSTLGAGQIGIKQDCRANYLDADALALRKNYAAKGA